MKHSHSPTQLNITSFKLNACRKFLFTEIDKPEY